MADITGIFMVEAPGQYTLVKNVRHLHADPEGILSTAVAGDDGFLHIEENAWPGQELRTYLPKQMSLGEKLRETLTPSEASQACCTLLRMKEKRMDADTAATILSQSSAVTLANGLVKPRPSGKPRPTRSAPTELQAAVAAGLRRPR